FRTFGDPAGGGVARLSVVSGNLPVLCPEFFYEALIHRCVDRSAIDQRRDRSDRLVAEGRENKLVKSRSASDKRQSRLQPGILVLLGETEGHGRYHHGEDSVGVTLDLRQVRTEVGGAERGPELLYHLPAGFLKSALKAANLFPAEGVVCRDRRDLLITKCFRDVLAERMVRLTRGPSGSDSPFYRLALCEVIGRDHGPNGRDPVFIHLWRQGVAFVREEDTGHRMYVVAL